MRGFLKGRVSLLFLPHGSLVHEGESRVGPELRPKGQVGSSHSVSFPFLSASSGNQSFSSVCQKEQGDPR